MTGAEIKAVCTEAGYVAIREDRFVVDTDDFIKGKERVLAAEESEGDDYLHMFS